MQLFPPLVLKKLFHIPVSVSLWMFDFCIMLSQMMYHNLEDLLYGIILLMVISYITGLNDFLVRIQIRNQAYLYLGAGAVLALLEQELWDKLRGN